MTSPFYTSLLALCLLTSYNSTNKYSNSPVNTNHPTDEPKIVLVSSVDYYYFNWQDWGLHNDYLQEKLISDLTTQFPNKYMFYTEEKLNELGLNPELEIKLEFSDITIGDPEIVHERYGKVGDNRRISAAAVPPSSISTSNTPNIIYTTKTINTKATLQCKIYEWQTENEIFSSQLSSTYKWEEDVSYASAAGSNMNEKFAKPLPNKNELNASASQIITPLNRELGKKLMELCYKKTYKKIKAELESAIQ